MQVEQFWQYWKVREDPFRAEEARHDPVLTRLLAADVTHPDFQKVYGDPSAPSAAVVFGEKGSGKTALRLLLEKRLADHNEKHPDHRVWVVGYDDLNPVLDRFMHTLRPALKRDDQPLDHFRLADHQDAILSQIVTGLIDSLITPSPPLPRDARKLARKMGRARRVDFGLLAALYDQPRTGNALSRWHALSRMLRLSWLPTLAASKWIGLLMLLIAAIVWLVGWMQKEGMSGLHLAMVGLSIAAAVMLLGHWAWHSLRLWTISRKLVKELRVIDRPAPLIRSALAEISAREMASIPLPSAADQDTRYQLTDRLLGVMEAIGVKGVIVLIDRIDEPVIVNGDPRKMKSLIWPMFNNKFLQQNRVGLKLLLPGDLRHLLWREEVDFFQRARLDKQNMIERLVWSGPTLYDVCSKRLSICREPASEPITLTDLFDSDVTRQDLIDALEQMRQPRDCFKFLYQLIQEHCANVTAEQPSWKIPRITLNHVRKMQSQRVQDLSRGLAPA